MSVNQLTYNQSFWLNELRTAQVSPNYTSFAMAPKKGSTAETPDFAALIVDALSNPVVIEKLQSLILESDHLRKVITAPLQEQMNILLDKLASKDKLVHTMQQEISSLKLEVDALEQYGRRQNLRLTGVTELPGEDTHQTALAVVNDVMKISPPLSEVEVDRIHRLGP